MRISIYQLMNERGYLVFSFRKPKQIGEVVESWTHHYGFCNHPVVVVAEATYAELCEQGYLLYGLDKPLYDWGYCYRVTTD